MHTLVLTTPVGVVGVYGWWRKVPAEAIPPPLLKRSLGHQVPCLQLDHHHRYRFWMVVVCTGCHWCTSMTVILCVFFRVCHEHGGWCKVCVPGYRGKGRVGRTISLLRCCPPRGSRPLPPPPPSLSRGACGGGGGGEPALVMTVVAVELQHHH